MVKARAKFDPEAGPGNESATAAEVEELRRELAELRGQLSSLSK